MNWVDSYPVMRFSIDGENIDVPLDARFQRFISVSGVYDDDEEQTRKLVDNADFLIGESGFMLRSIAGLVIKLVSGTVTRVCNEIDEVDRLSVENERLTKIIDVLLENARS